MFENIQEIINELHRMKKEYNAPQGCCVRTQERNGYRSKCLSIAIKALSEVQTLAKAKADGRLVVLPCKVGDSIYRPEGLKYSVFWTITNVTIYPDEIVFTDDSDNIFTLDDIGKTVFLTYEEAEKALGCETGRGKKDE